MKTVNKFGGDLNSIIVIEPNWVWRYVDLERIRIGLVYLPKKKNPVKTKKTGLALIMKKGKFIGVTWEKRYSELAAFKKKHGHTLVPQVSKKSLNAWCYTMRVKEHWLTPKQRKKLRDLGFTFSDSFSQKWEIRYQELVAFKKKYKHTLVPKSMPTLYAWCRSMRRTKKQLNREKKEKLKKIGFEWEGARPKNN